MSDEVSPGGQRTKENPKKERTHHIEIALIDSSIFDLDNVASQYGRHGHYSSGPQTADRAGRNEAANVTGKPTPGGACEEHARREEDDWSAPNGVGYTTIQRLEDRRR